jgi:hypothetical protein
MLFAAVLQSALVPQGKKGARGRDVSCELAIFAVFKIAREGITMAIMIFIVK